MTVSPGDGGGDCKGISRQNVVLSNDGVGDRGRLGGLGLPVTCTLSAVLSVSMEMGSKKASNMNCKQRF